MTDPRRSPTVRRRRLGIELRTLREAAGLTAQDVTKHLEWSPGKVTRLEKGQAIKPMVADTRLLLSLYGVPPDDPRCEELVTLTREARQRGWWNTYKDVLGDAYVEFEAGADKIYTYQAALIPGLLQTPAYAADLYRKGSLIKDATEVDQLVRLRMDRQAILSHEEPPCLWAVIEETSLLRPFGTAEDRREQLSKLIESNKLDHVTVQVLPLDAGFHPAITGPFVILDFPDDDPSLVYIETRPNSLYLEERDEIRRYNVVFQNLTTLALSPEASAAHLAQLAERLE